MDKRHGEAFQKRKHKWPTNFWKIFNLTTNQGNTNSNHWRKLSVPTAPSLHASLYPHSLVVFPHCFWAWLCPIWQWQTYCKQSLDKHLCISALFLTPLSYENQPGLSYPVTRETHGAELNHEAILEQPTHWSPASCLQAVNKPRWDQQSLAQVSRTSLPTLDLWEIVNGCCSMTLSLVVVSMHQ